MTTTELLDLKRMGQTSTFPNRFESGSERLLLYASTIWPAVRRQSVSCMTVERSHESLTPC